jgi:hypothetical protein
MGSITLFFFTQLSLSLSLFLFYGQASSVNHLITHGFNLLHQSLYNIFHFFLPLSLSLLSLSFCHYFHTLYFSLLYRDSNMKCGVIVTILLSFIPCILIYFCYRIGRIYCYYCCCCGCILQ